MNRVNGIRFNGLHSYYDFGMWLSERPDWGDPEPKLNLVEIPGADGMLDLTEANSGEVKFSNRMATLTFAAMVKADRQEQFKARIRNALHGKVCTIVPDEDPNWYYRGRCTVTFMDQMSWKLRIMITVDADPYAMKVEETFLDFRRTPGTTKSFDIDLGENVIASWGSGSDFRFGTEEFPDGVVFGDNLDLTVEWPENAGVRSSASFRVIKVYDADGHTYTKDVSSLISVAGDYGNLHTTAGGNTTITMSELTTAGIIPAKVWRIDIGVGQCKVYVRSVYVYFRVWNERKTVVPIITLASSSQSFPGLSVIVNGYEHAIVLGTNQYEAITLVEGWNDIYVEAIEDPQAYSELSMTYREGRL